MFCFYVYLAGRKAGTPLWGKFMLVICQFHWTAGIIILTLLLQSSPISTVVVITPSFGLRYVTLYNQSYLPVDEIWVEPSNSITEFE